MKNYISYALIASTAFLGGCATSKIDKLSSLPQKGHAYAQALSHEYEVLARQENDIYGDQIDATHFAVKGIQAASGLEVLPENPDRWESIYKEDEREALHAARERLVFALYKSGTIIDPANSARAVALYDCWIEEAAEGSTAKTGHPHQDVQLRKCKTGFMKTLQLLEANVRAKAPTYMIWFGLQNSTIDRQGAEEVDQITKTLEHLRNHKVLIHCSSDRIGGRAHNLKLSQKRADVVKAALLAKGMPEERIEATVGVGEKGKRDVDPYQRRCDIHLR